MWVSDEPFGWATYHYGRWGYAEDIGWYWVPGRRWAPAWVSWRRGSDHIVWAPLPPSRGDGVDVDVSISISVGEIPEFYWVAVPARRFLAPDIGIVVLDDEPEIRDVIARTEFLGVPRVTNNIVVNNVIDVDVVVEATGEQVETVEVRTVDDPREAQASGDELAVFQAEVEAEPDAKPQEVREVSEVERVTRPDADAGEGEAAGTEPAEPDAAAAPEGEEEQPAAGATPEEAPAETAAEPESGEPAQQQAEEAQPGEQPAPQQAEEQPGRGQPEDVPAQQRAEEQPEQPADEATGTTAPPEPPAAPEEDARGQRGEGRGQGRECDPATDPDCEPAQ